MTATTSSEIRLIGIDGIPEVNPGDDLGRMIADAINAAGGLEPGDTVVITHKVVSKAEGRLVDLRTIEPSALALEFADQYAKDARQVEVVLRESRRIVRMDHGVIISETRHGFICANAGVDASNVHADVVCLLPENPDGSASRLRQDIADHLGFDESGAPAVIITDSWGRPWRNGIVNFAIGVAGIAPLVDYRGQYDAAGYELHVTVLAIADEIAAAAELVMHKLATRPVAIVRGYQTPVPADAGSGQQLIMDPARDMFR